MRRSISMLLSAVLLAIAGLGLGGWVFVNREPVASTRAAADGRVAARFYDALAETASEGDIARLSELTAAGFVDHPAGDAFGSGVDGLGGWVAAVRASYAGLRLSARVLHSDEGLVSVEVEWRGRPEPDAARLVAGGLPEHWQGIDVIRIEHGLVAERWSSVAMPSVSPLTPPVRLWCGSECEGTIARVVAQPAGEPRLLPLPEPALVAVLGGWVTVTGDGETLAAANGQDPMTLIPLGTARQLLPGAVVAMPRGGGALELPAGVALELIVFAMEPNREMEREHALPADTDRRESRFSPGNGVDSFEIERINLARVDEIWATVAVHRLWLPRGNSALFDSEAVVLLERGCAASSPPGAGSNEPEARMTPGNAVALNPSTVASCADDGLTVLLAVTFGADSVG